MPARFRGPPRGARARSSPLATDGRGGGGLRQSPRGRRAPVRPRDGPSEQERGDVPAGNQKDEPDRAPKHQRLRVGFRSVEVLLERHQTRTPPLALGRERVRATRAAPTSSSDCACAIVTPGRSFPSATRTRLLPGNLRPQETAPRPLPRPQSHGGRENRSVNRHHADNGGWHAIEANNCSNDICAAVETTTPEPIADHRRLEPPTRDRRTLPRRPETHGRERSTHAQDREHVRRQLLSRDSLGGAELLGSDVVRELRFGADCLKGPRWLDSSRPGTRPA